MLPLKRKYFLFKIIIFLIQKKKIPSPLCFLFLCFVLVCSSSATLPEREKEKEKKKESLCNLWWRWRKKKEKKILIKDINRKKRESLIMKISFFNIKKQDRGLLAIAKKKSSITKPWLTNSGLPKTPKPNKKTITTSCGDNSQKKEILLKISLLPSPP